MNWQTLNLIVDNFFRGVWAGVWEYSFIFASPGRRTIALLRLFSIHRLISLGLW